MKATNVNDFPGVGQHLKQTKILGTRNNGGIMIAEEPSQCSRNQRSGEAE